jgi:hypothetical protein
VVVLDQEVQELQVKEMQVVQDRIQEVQQLIRAAQVVVPAVLQLMVHQA